MTAGRRPGVNEMGPLLRLVFGLLALAGIVLAVGMTLPGHVTVARTTVINAPENQVFPYVNSLRRFNQWSPWAARDPNTQYTFSGPESGLGAKMEWKSEHPDVGVGSQEIVASDTNRHVESRLDLGDMGQAEAAYDLNPAGAGTRVTWRFETDVGANPLMRWMGLTFDRLIGADYQTGLERLRKLVETEHGPPISPDGSENQAPADQEPPATESPEAAPPEPAPPSQKRTLQE